MLSIRAIKRLPVFKQLRVVMYEKAAIKLLRSIEGCKTIVMEADSISGLVSWSMTSQGYDSWSDLTIRLRKEGVLC